MCVSNNNNNLDNLIIENANEGHTINTEDVFHLWFEPQNGEGKFREFHFLKNTEGKRVGIRFSHTGSRRNMTYTYIPGEGMFLGTRKVNKAKVCNQEMHDWLYWVTRDIV